MKNKTMTYGLFAIFLITVAAVITCGKQNIETEIHYPPAHMEEVEEAKEAKEELPVIKAQEPTSEAPVKVEAPVIVPEVVPEITPEEAPEQNDGVIEEEESNANE